MPISNSTFDEMKHYVSVRLQQGVPLLDSDWNEQDDIRRNELRTFIKWFIGDGVPEGNDGFLIKPMSASLVLKPKEPSLDGTVMKVILDESDAAEYLGFTVDNSFDQRTGNYMACLYLSWNQKNLTGKKITLKCNNEVNSYTFEKNPESLRELAVMLSTYLHINAKEVNETKNFIITGGDGTFKNAGRILVDGMEVFNVADISFQDQLLYKNAGLAEKWGVPVINWEPVIEKTYLVYLDVWERIITSDDDPSLINEDIGDETCVRYKREWAVRIEESEQYAKIEHKPDHDYLKLAEITCPSNDAADFIIMDLRVKGLKMICANDFRQVALDAFGKDYNFNTTSKSTHSVSLLDAINALLQGTLPLNNNIPSIELPNSCKEQIIADKLGRIWVFYNISNIKKTFIDAFVKCYKMGKWFNYQIKLSENLLEYVAYVNNNCTDVLYIYKYLINEKFKYGMKYYNISNDKYTEEIEFLNKSFTDKKDLRLLSNLIFEDGNGSIWIFIEEQNGDNHKYYNCNFFKNKWSVPEKPLIDVFEPLTIKGKSLSDGSIWVGYIVSTTFVYRYYNNQIWGDEKIIYNIGVENFDISRGNHSKTIYIIYYLNNQLCIYQQNDFNNDPEHMFIQNDNISNNFTIVAGGLRNVFIFYLSNNILKYQNTMPFGWSSPVPLGIDGNIKFQNIQEIENKYILICSEKFIHGREVKQIELKYLCPMI